MVIISFRVHGEEEKLAHHSTNNFLIEKNHPLQRRLATLLLFLTISVAMLALGGWLTYLGMGEWYRNLKVPSWQPPGWLFSPVWTTLLTLLAVATWLVFHGEGNSTFRRVALGLYGAQIVLNITWSLLFFALHMPALALIDIFFLDLVLAGMVFIYGRLSLVASMLILPYLIWLGLATAINFWIVLNN